MTERGYELKHSRNITKGDVKVRYVPLADYIVCVSTPTMTAITREGTTDEETLRIVDWFTA